MKLQTIVETGKSGIGIAFSDKVLVIGSCFADNVGAKMKNAGLDVCVNPFGTLYNPVSVCNSLQRLACGVPFSQDDCIEMGANAGLTCSFSHHTSFARPTASEFLEVANESLAHASAFFADCSKVVVTLGTAWCYKSVSSGEVVSNCLKRPASEFIRERLSLQGTITLLDRLLTRNPSKKFIFTLSPIRHLKDTAHGNQLSKSTLLLAIDAICQKYPDRAEYFPAYEIVMDELRDYRFYAEDMVHPTDQTVSYLWERFINFAIDDSEKEKIAANEKAFRQSQHRQMH